jgi:hypothetical protein
MLSVGASAVGNDAGVPLGALATGAGAEGARPKTLGLGTTAQGGESAVGTEAGVLLDALEPGAGAKGARPEPPGLGTTAKRAELWTGSVAAALGGLAAGGQVAMAEWEAEDEPDGLGPLGIAF